MTERKIQNFDFGFDLGEVDEESKHFVDTMKSDETKRKNSMWLKKFTNHKEHMGILAPVDSLTKYAINSIICSFMINARKENSESF